MFATLLTDQNSGIDTMGRSFVNSLVTMCNYGASLLFVKKEFKPALPYAYALADGSSCDCSAALRFKKNWIPACAGMTNADVPCAQTVTVALPLHAMRHQLFNTSTSPCQGSRPANLLPIFGLEG